MVGVEQGEPKMITRRNVRDSDPRYAAMGTIESRARALTIQELRNAIQMPGALSPETKRIAMRVLSEREAAIANVVGNAFDKIGL